MASYKVGILGATGAVGEQMRIVLAERKFPISELRLFGSARSAGKVINYEGQDIVVQEASLEAFKGLDLLLGAADNPVAKQFLPEAAKMGIHVVDNSSAFRLDPDVPLVIPEVNPEDVKLSKGLIANPNCATIIGPGPRPPRRQLPSPPRPHPPHGRLDLSGRLRRRQGRHRRP